MNESTNDQEQSEPCFHLHAEPFSGCPPSGSVSTSSAVTPAGSAADESVRLSCHSPSCDGHAGADLPCASTITDRNTVRNQLDRRKRPLIREGSDRCCAAEGPAAVPDAESRTENVSAAERVGDSVSRDEDRARCCCHTAEPHGATSRLAVSHVCVRQDRIRGPVHQSFCVSQWTTCESRNRCAKPVVASG